MRVPVVNTNDIVFGQITNYFTNGNSDNLVISFNINDPAPGLGSTNFYFNVKVSQININDNVTTA